MKFKLSGDEELVRKSACDFAARRLANMKLDSMDHIPAELLKEMGALGYLSLHLQEKWGGIGANWIQTGALVEEVAKASIALSYALVLSYAVTLTLVKYGTEKLREKWLPELARGDAMGCICATEPGCGLDLASMETRAVIDRGEYLLTGRKGPVSFGGQACFGIILAKTDPKAGHRGLSAFLVPLNYPGLNRAEALGMGLKPSTPSWLTLERVRVPFSYRLGKEGEGFQINKETGLFSDMWRVMIGLICLGAAQKALGLAVSYCGDRMAFGRPIIQFQAVSEKFAEHATMIEAARWTCYRALWLKDHGAPMTKEAAMCGWWCPRVATAVIENALLLHGHAGYSDEHPFEQMLRDVVGLEMVAGTEQLMKLVIARWVAGDRAVPEPLRALLA